MILDASREIKFSLSRGVPKAPLWERDRMTGKVSGECRLRSAGRQGGGDRSGGRHESCRQDAGKHGQGCPRSLLFTGCAGSSRCSSARSLRCGNGRGGAAGFFPAPCREAELRPWKCVPKGPGRTGGSGPNGRVRAGRGGRAGRAELRWEREGKRAKAALAAAEGLRTGREIRG
jgi:hypothetical protein